MGVNLAVMSAKVEEHSQTSDPELVKLCLQGSKQSFAYLYQRYQQKVRSTLYQLCGTEYLDDLVQEVFLRAWKGLSKFRAQSQFSTWLYRIAWNVACDQRRVLAQMRSRMASNSVSTFAENDELQNDSMANLVSPHSTSNLNDLHYQDLVGRGLAQLSLDHRTVLVWHDLEDIPQKEIAEILSVPVGTVKSRLFHARAALKRFLEAQGAEL